MHESEESLNDEQVAHRIKITNSVKIASVATAYFVPNEYYQPASSTAGSKHYIKNINIISH